MTAKLLSDNGLIARNLTDKLWLYLSIVPADVAHSLISLTFRADDSGQNFI